MQGKDRLHRQSWAVGQTGSADGAGSRSRDGKVWEHVLRRGWREPGLGQIAKGHRSRMEGAWGEPPAETPDRSPG